MAAVDMRRLGRLPLLELASACLLAAAVITSFMPTSPPRRAVAQAPSPERVNPHAAAIAAYQQRVEDYLILRRKTADELPPMEETTDPVQIMARERALGAAIARARAGAEPGDLFGAELRDFFIRAIRSNWKHRSGEDRRAILRDLPRLPAIEVNEPYPTSQPLATFPPAMLRELPPLPDDLEYRLYGDHLIIRDAEANLVVDVLPNVLPGEPGEPPTGS